MSEQGSRTPQGVREAAQALLDECLRVGGECAVCTMTWDEASEQMEHEPGCYAEALRAVLSAPRSLPIDATVPLWNGEPLTPEYAAERLRQLNYVLTIQATYGDPYHGVGFYAHREALAIADFYQKAAKVTDTRATTGAYEPQPNWTAGSAPIGGRGEQAGESGKLGEPQLVASNTKEALSLGGAKADPTPASASPASPLGEPSERAREEAEFLSLQRQIRVAALEEAVGVVGRLGGNLRIAAEIAAAIRSLPGAAPTPTPEERMTYPYPVDAGQTHYEGCWRDRGHHNCAVAEVERLRALLDELGVVICDTHCHHCRDENDGVTEVKHCRACNQVRALSVSERAKKCAKCGGAGWVWGDDNNRYSCDWCPAVQEAIKAAEARRSSERR